MLHKIFLTLLLVTFCELSTAQAQTECLLEGHYSLDLEPFGSSDPFWLSGNIGNQQIRLDVTPWFSDSTYKVRGWVKNTRVDLDMDVRWQPYTIRGWISHTYVNWTGYNGNFFGYQNCIK